ncbi:hypothetical protein BGZ58_007213 [Dissophora ornata]|nr:hypothetical protein BGZ58_007213 [Dissophora ornata]
MQSADSSYLARSKSAGFEKKAPPPIRPKPSALTSAPTDTSAPVAPSPSTASSKRTSITVTDDGAPTSSSFGDLKKAFERQQNSSPLFSGGVGTFASPSRTPGRGISPGHASHASISRVQQQGSSSLAVPPPNSRPRSVSSPAPPLRENDKINADALSSDPKDGIDNSQPDFRHAKTTTQARHQFTETHSSGHYSTTSAGSSDVIGFSPYQFIDITAKFASAPSNVRIYAIIIIAPIIQLLKASPSTSTTDEAHIIRQDTYTA